MYKSVADRTFQITSNKTHEKTKLKTRLKTTFAGMDSSNQGLKRTTVPPQRSGLAVCLKGKGEIGENDSFRAKRAKSDELEKLEQFREEMGGDEGNYAVELWN